ncbi:MAG: cytochrome c3 family protein, partial [Candidatus Krumholzibacteria bacterium]|nr:cytochrome c3 family protein [Candidatus Krumholzibacteria bacterium]
MKTVLTILFLLALATAALGQATTSNCVTCHQDFEEEDGPSYLLSRDVHAQKGLGCEGCHGGDPTLDDMDEVRESPGWRGVPDHIEVPEFCASCHSDASYMHEHNPSLPVDQLDKFRTSFHGKRIFEQRDQKAANCISCHGVHEIAGAELPFSKTHPLNLPATCGACHADADYMKEYGIPTDQLADYEQSVHGKALLDRGDLGAPACNDCHGNHAAMPPEISNVSQVCRTCHAGNGELFDGSKHKLAFERNGWPECERCHGNHSIDDTDDSMLSEASNPLCYECHREYAEDNPNCEETAKYFHASITSLASESESLERLIHPLAKRGLDVDPLTATVG